MAVEQIESAVSQRDFERAQFYRDQEVSARENLQFVRERFDVKSSERRVVVGKQDIDEVVSRWTGVPLASISEDEGDKLLRMEEQLHRRVISQEKAISALARAIRRSRAGLKNPNRPVGSFIFLGPTGVGKTELARALASFLFGSDNALIRFDMSEYMEKHSVSKLIGSPPGYVGHDEGGQLTEKVKRHPYSVVLLDEIEKAHPDVFNILLQVFEDGHLTDGLGNRVDFKNAIIIMTSNIGARFIQKKAGLGFQSSDVSRDQPEPVGPGAGRSPAHVQSGVRQPHRRDHRLRPAVGRRPPADHGAARAPAQRAPVGPSAEHHADPGGGGLDHRRDLQGSFVRRAPAAPRDSAVRRGSAVRGTHPRHASRGSRGSVFGERVAGLSAGRRPCRRPEAGLKRLIPCKLW